MKFLMKLWMAIVLIATSPILFAQDKMLDMLKEEIKGQMEVLQKGDYPPYYMNYRVVDNHTRILRSNMGAISSESETKQIIFVPQIRIGSPDFDNFRDNQNGTLTNMFMGPPTVLLPEDLKGGIEAFRGIIREEVNNRYKFAVTSLERAKAKDDAGAQNERTDKSPDFTTAKAEKYFEKAITPAMANFNVDKWKEKIKKFSAVFAENRDVINGSVTVTYRIWRKYFVSTEGANIAENQTYAYISISAETMAEDGMELPLNKSYFAFFPDQFPSDEQIINDIREISTKLSQLRTAPLVQPFTGPALLSGSASGVFFHEIFGHRIEGQKMKSENDGQTFKSMVGDFVLPKEISVFCDPTIKYYNRNHALNGHYVFDDQGVRGERVEVVKEGVLKNFLMTRTALEGHLASNGHARADFINDPTSRQSNLIVEGAHPKTDKELRELLINEAKKQSKEYGYFFKTVTGGFTFTGRASTNSFNVTPLEVYRIYVDGRPDELVRGVDIIGTPLSMFSNIEYAGDDFEIFTGTCGASSGQVPVTCISPTVFVSKIELQRKPKPTTTPAILERPATEHQDQVVFEAMEEEMVRNMSQLKMDKPNTPPILFISYTLAETKSIKTSASEGVILQTAINPGERISSVRLIVGDNTFSSDYSYTGNGIMGANFVTVEDHPAQIKAAFWSNSDIAYKFAVEAYNSKRSNIKNANLTDQEKALNEYIPMQPKEVIVPHQSIVLGKNRYEELIVRLSSAIVKDKAIVLSGVELSGVETTYYYTTSEGVRSKQAVMYADITLRAKVRLPSGQVVSDEHYITCPDLFGVADLPYLLAEVKKFSNHLIATKSVGNFDEYYYGPVLFEDEAVAKIFSNNLISVSGILAVRKPISVIATAARAENVSEISRAKPLEERLGKKVLDSRISVFNMTNMPTFNGMNLFGSYNVDAQGVTPLPKMQLIDNGILKSLLTHNVPTVKFSESSGSYRFGARARAMVQGIAPGVLFIEAPKGEGREELKASLLTSLREEGLEYGYIVRKYANGTDQFLYRVSASDGSETLLTNCELPPIPFTKLKRVLGVAKDQYAQNFLYREAIPCAIVCPSGLLLEDIEINIKRPTIQKDSELVR